MVTAVLSICHELKEFQPQMCVQLLIICEKMRFPGLSIPCMMSKKDWKRYELNILNRVVFLRAHSLSFWNHKFAFVGYILLLILFCYMPMWMLSYLFFGQSLRLIYFFCSSCWLNEFRIDLLSFWLWCVTFTLFLLDIQPIDDSFYAICWFMLCLMSPPLTMVFVPLSVSCAKYTLLI